ncbi:MAG: hypothetical protein A2081_06310 [Elusimicrobia bacterium GWC2_61_19]|nr:MAG: hypothetical protein A2081_06310 [Elusimicrobia bacterium GWC2_61_19]
MEDAIRHNEPEGSPKLPPDGQAAAEPAHTPYGMQIPSISTRTQRPAPETARKTSMQQPPPPPAGRGWDMELPLIPTTLFPGTYNRFAHAAAMNIVDDPGLICNPLMVFGEPGSGKTHFINFIAYALSESLGLDNIFVTDGIRFSRGIDRAIAEGKIEQLEARLAGVKVLIIDDVHLLLVSAENGKYISKWLNDFVDRNKQVILASGQTPDRIAGLEEAAGFLFTQGWTVDLKSPSPGEYKAILLQRIKELEIRISENELADVFSSLAMPLSEAIKVLENIKKMEKAAPGTADKSSHSRTLGLLLGTGEAPGAGAVTDDDAKKAAAWRPAAAKSSFRLGIFCPAGGRREAEFALYALHERARELGLNTDWGEVLIQEYAVDGLYAALLRAGDHAAGGRVNGVVILGGPVPSPALRHTAAKILGSLRIKSSWLARADIKSKAAYAKILMDLL